MRELRSPLKDQRLTPSQQDKIGQYYTSKLRKGSDPGTGGSPIDDLARDILAYDASNKGSPYSPSRVDSAYLSRLDKREPPVLPPKPGTEDPSVPPPLPPRTRQEALEERHQELLRKQKQLQVKRSIICQHWYTTFGPDRIVRKTEHPFFHTMSSIYSKMPQIGADCTSVIAFQQSVYSRFFSQEQYARLQQLQREQKVRPSSPSTKLRSLPIWLLR